MLTLGITTSETECGIALCADGAVIDERCFHGSRQCVEELIPLAQDILFTNEMSFGSPDLLAVDTGPGSLTGIKIGMVAIRTIAQVMDKPVAAVSSLHVISCAAPAEAKRIMVVTGSTAKEVFTGVYRRDEADGLTAMLSPNRLDTPATAAARFIEHNGDGDLYLTGNALERVAGELAARNFARPIRVAPPELRAPRASVVCALALTVTAVKWNELQANYACLTNAERAANDSAANTPL